MDVIQERLEREYGQTLIATAPSVNYQVALTDDSELEVDNPSRMPAAQNISEVREPWVEVSIIAPSRYIGPIMELVTGRRGEFRNMEYLQAANYAGASSNGGDDQQARDARVHLRLRGSAVGDPRRLPRPVEGPHPGIRVDGLRADRLPVADLVKLDVLVNQSPVDALSLITHKGDALPQGRKLARKLKELIPRQLFEVPIQAAHRQQGHCARDRQGLAQERHRQVLRRRRDPKTQVAGTAGRGEKAPQEDRPRRSAARGIHGRSQTRPGVTRALVLCQEFSSLMRPSESPLP